MSRKTVDKTAEDAAAAELEAIVEKHQAALLRYATRLLNSPDAAQDVVQDTFIKLFRAWRAGSHPTAQLSAWLYRVTHNAAVDHIRSESRRNALLLRHTEEEFDHQAVPAPTHGSSEAAELTSHLLNQLGLRERQLVILKVYEEKSYREISEITGLSEGNIGYILHHAMKRLSTLLNEELARQRQAPAKQETHA